MGIFPLILGCLAILVTSCATSRTPSVDLSRFEYQRPQMGLPFRIVLFAAGKDEADAAAEAAFQRISQLNDIMSDYEDESELTLLSKSSGQGKSVPVGPDLWRVLERAQALSVKSGGAFDITVGPYVKLWRRARRERKLPDPALLAAAAKSVGYRYLHLDPARKTVRLDAPDMRLDLGGIAKGYAVDEALKVLKGRGIRSALVSGGGDLAVSEPPPGQSGWRIELPPLDVTNAPPARFVRLRNAALATSGDLFQRLEIDGRRYSHIVDPRTGVGLTDHSLVTVIARDCMTADSHTKVVSVLGPDAGMALLRGVAGVEARVVRKPGDVVERRETKGFARFYD